MNAENFPLGEQLPSLRTEIPGPRSRQLAKRLAEVECRGITYLSHDFPVFWKKALGGNVEDVDGNTFVDFTAAFGVASLGHANRTVAAAVAEQLMHLPHGMGDVHPPSIKVELLERLTSLFPGKTAQAILCNGGSEAVEAALKTAYLSTGRPGVITFEGAYHGLSYGTLAVSGHLGFREPFHSQVAQFSYRAHYPRPGGDRNRETIDRSIREIERLMMEADNKLQPVGAILVEPIQGRGGILTPPPGWLRALRDVATRKNILLVVDEIMTGFGRTGKRFAVDHENVIPDLLCVGKSLSGMFPISACLGTEEVMQAWMPSSGEALHTSTFLGHPLGCAAALASINELEKKKLASRADRLGRDVLREIRSWRRNYSLISEVRGRGLMIGIELSRGEDKGIGFEIAREVLKKGLIVLPSGMNGNVLTLTPPLTLAGKQLEWGLSVLKEAFKKKL